MLSGNMKLPSKNDQKLEINISSPSNKKMRSQVQNLKNSDLLHLKKMNSVESISRKPQILPQGKCPQCQALLIKVEELHLLNSEVSTLKEKNLEFKQEIQLMSSNFSYILELAAQNILKGVKSRVKNLLVEKQNIIQKQSQIIKRLQSQSLILINKIDDQIECQQKIEILQEKLKELQAENISLKKKSSKKQSCFNFEFDESIQLNSTDICSGGLSPKDLSSQNFQFRSMDIGKDSQGFGLKKRKTLELQGNSNGSSMNIESQQINLEDLKHKINKMKQQLINDKL